MATNNVVVKKYSNNESVTLAQRHYMTSGGEAELYKIGAQVYKVYHTPRPVEYIKKLQWLLQHPTKNTSQVTDILLDANGQVTGYCMPYIKGDTLGQMFPSAWQQRNRWATKDTLDIVRKMSVVLSNIHATGCVVVDCNDGNWVVSNNEPFVLDSDSWQLPSHRANAIMPSIEDPTSPKKFNEGTDWFSWAVITFMLWTGIHPYKGMHPAYPKNSLDKRMKDGVSILDKAVQVPPAARSTDDIPPRLREWYLRVFEHKTRSAPPANWWDASAPKVSAMVKGALASMSGVSVEKKGRLPTAVAVLDQQYLVLNDNTIVSWENPSKAVAKLSTTATWHVDRYWTIGEVYPQAPQASLWSVSGRMFVRMEEQQHGLIEMMQVNQRWVVKQQWPCIVNACTWFERMFVQRLMRASFVNAVDNQGGVHSIRTPWLDQLQVHAGVSVDPQNHWVVAAAKGTTDYTLFYFDGTGTLLDQQAVQSTSLQFVTLPSGVGLVATPEQWFLAKGGVRKQWSPQGWAESDLLGCSGGLVHAVLQHEHVVLRLTK